MTDVALPGFRVGFKADFTGVDMSWEQWGQGPGPITSLAQDLEEALGVVGRLCSKIGHIAPLCRGQLVRFQNEPPAEATVTEVLKRLRARPQKDDYAKTLRVTGGFCPTVLLTAGWWQRRTTNDAPEVEPLWRDPLQRWLWTGFEQWGPSWQLTEDPSQAEVPVLLGQLGDGDEVNSLLVVARGPRALDLAGQWHAPEEGSLAYPAEVRGLLCHRSFLDSSSGTARFPGPWGKTFDWCLLLEREEHHVMPIKEELPYYSAYLWQCWAPRERLVDGAPLPLADCYFAWEHTDLTSPDAIQYNLDSLLRKEAFLRGRYGDLVLVQKSSSVVPGDPIVPTAVFRQMIGIDDRGQVEPASRNGVTE